MLAIIIFLFVGNYLLDLFIDLLNFRHSIKSNRFNTEEHRIRFREYFRANFWLSQSSSILSFVLILYLLSSGVFGTLSDALAERIASPVLAGLTYFGILGFAADLLSLPFSIYRVFVIEERFGFNKTTMRTFIFDKLKGWLLMVLIGGPIAALIIWIYLSIPDLFWLLAWITTAVIILLTTVLYTSILLPLFNKLSPIKEGSLSDRIAELCSKTRFPLSELFVMDGSKRSTKANAFFSGLGSKKTIVLYDTLVNEYSEDEILAVLAHEIGHYKKKHTRTMIVFSMLQTGFMFWLMSLFLNSEAIAHALGASMVSFQIGLTGFVILYSPLSTVFSTLMNALSRKHEYEADAFARENFSAAPLVSALDKLHKDALSNPDPHPAYVFIHYSHPPLYLRTERLMRGETG